MKYLRMDVCCNFALLTGQSNCSSVHCSNYHVSLSSPFPCGASEKQNPLGSQIPGLAHFQ